MTAFLTWLAYSPLNVFAWLVYVVRIAFLVISLWWERSEFLTPSRLRQARQMRIRIKRILRAI